MREAWQAGVVLTGVSAGSICWHVGGTTDSFGPDLRPITNGLGLVPYSNGVHYDSEEQRRPLFQSLVADGTLPTGYATDDGVGRALPRHRVRRGAHREEGQGRLPGRARAGRRRSRPGSRRDCCADGSVPATPAMSLTPARGRLVGRDLPGRGRRRADRRTHLRRPAAPRARRRDHGVAAPAGARPAAGAPGPGGTTRRLRRRHAGAARDRAAARGQGRPAAADARRGRASSYRRCRRGGRRAARRDADAPGRDVRRRRPDASSPFDADLPAWVERNRPALAAHDWSDGRPRPARRDSPSGRRPRSTPSAAPASCTPTSTRRTCSSTRRPSP